MKNILSVTLLDEAKKKMKTDTPKEIFFKRHCPDLLPVIDDYFIVMNSNDYELLVASDEFEWIKHDKHIRNGNMYACKKTQWKDI